MSPGRQLHKNFAIPHQRPIDVMMMHKRRHATGKSPMMNFSI